MTRSVINEESEKASGECVIEVENMGGIDSCRVALPPGVSVLTGPNATNRTSFLRSLGAVLGGTTGTLKSDADSGHVTLKIDDETYSRTYERTSTGVVVDGDGYSDNDDLVDLCVALLGDNPARQAVENDEDIREPIMRPVDTGEIENRIRELKNERSEVDAELQGVQERRSKLPGLEDRRSDLEEQLDDVEAEIAELSEELEGQTLETDGAAEANELADLLDDRRHDLKDTEREIEVVESEQEAMQEELTTLREERDDLSGRPDDELEAVTEELSAHRTRKTDIDETISSLHTIIEFNEEVLANGSFTDDDPAGESAVLNELAPESEQTVTCWTCGSTVQKAEISERLDDLRGLAEEKRSEREDLESRIATVEEKRRDLERQAQRRDELKSSIRSIETRLDDSEQRIEELKTQREEFQEEIAELERELADVEELRESELLDVRERLNDRQYEQGQLEQQLESVDERIEDIESLPEEAELREERDRIEAELNQERDRIEDIETTAVEAFNDHMENVLEILNYENVSRVWIERKSKGPSSNHDSSTFDLHVVRETADGAVYEDYLAHLSESEREVVGLVVALAGNLVHEAHETVSFMLLDSIEAIDSSRIADLVEYFSEFTGYLVIALLPEDAEALSKTDCTVTTDQLA